jgi:hypothetical protein
MDVTRERRDDPGAASETERVDPTGQDGAADRAARAVERILRAAEEEARELVRAAQERERDAERRAELLIADAERRAEEIVARASRRMPAVARVLGEQAQLLGYQLERIAGEDDAALAGPPVLADAHRANATAAGEQARAATSERPEAPAPETFAAAPTGDPAPGPAAADPAPQAPVPAEREPERAPVERAVALRNGFAARVNGDARPATSHDDAFEGARVVALQMAVAGATRGEVDADLRRVFDLRQTDVVLDAVFGPGSGGTKRLGVH